MIRAWITFSRSWVERNGFICDICLIWKKLPFTTELICLSNFRAESNNTPRFFTYGLMKVDRDVSEEEISVVLSGGQKSTISVLSSAVLSSK